MNNSTYLTHYAKVIVNVGVCVEKGDLIKINFSSEHLPLVREMTKEAYKNGAHYVSLDLRDPEIERSRVNYLAEDFLDEFPNTEVQNQLNYAKSGYSMITIKAPTFSNQRDESIERASILTKTKSMAMRPCQTYGMENHNKWVVVNAPTIEWALHVFPNHSQEEAVKLLWELILDVSKSSDPTPIQAWKQHDSTLKKLAEKLNNYQFAALRFVNKKTNLTVSLVEDHVWLGGSETTKDGRTFMSNIPVEEVWTMPNKHHVNGYATMTKPFILAGQAINGIKFFFENGKITKMDPYNQILHEFLQTDEGAGMIGEVALVSANSSIAKTGVTFWSTLLDENAASHIAFGQAYIDTILNGSLKTKEELTALGMNTSAVHEDMMIGDHSMNVFGLLEQKEVLLMENGEWRI
ncbi:aminopeptidase [Shouchella lehensis]|uniref:aminopeptidase n=1 Tax=Shouchella lehensis TaxID=300825 RepID=UPI0023EC23E0|nr:aminopeptidase [Shouchella lehensis]